MQATPDPNASGTLRASAGTPPGQPASEPTPPASPHPHDPSPDETPRLDGSALGTQWLQAGHADPELPAGERYHIEQLLGMGANGRVYAVLDRNLERQVAVKVLAEAADRVGGVRQFIDEAKLMARLDHPNVLPVYDVAINASGQPHFSMKRIEGETLGKAIQDSEEGAQSPRMASSNAIVAIFISVCQALSYAHHRQIIHQDVKPDNIMLGNFGEVLLLDWGSASRMSEKGGASGPLYGTPLYMSPEQARGESAGISSDIYTVGASLFHALALRVPAWSDDPAAFLAMKRAGTIQPLGEAERRRVPPLLLSIALKAMAPRSEDRYLTIDALLHDLQQYQAGLAIAAARDSLWRRLQRWYRSHRELAWMSLVVALLLGLLGGLWYRSWLKEQSSWRLAFSDDFTRPAADLAADWRVLSRPSWPEDAAFKDVPLQQDGSWFPNQGGMSVGLRKGDSFNELDLTCRRSFPGNLRVEWDYRSFDSSEDINCYLGSDRKSGYTFHVGGWYDPTLVVLTRGPDYVRLDWTHITPLSIRVDHHFVMEREDRHVRLSIDGTTVIDYMAMGGMDAPDLPTFGFDSLKNSLHVSHVRVYSQRPPQLVTPLAVGDAFFSAKRYDEALAAYREILAAYPGSELATRAEFGIGLCLVRSGDDAAGAAALAAFERRHPDHAFAPFSMWERLHVAQHQGDGALEQRLRQDLARFQGSPVLRSVLAELSEDRCAMLTPKTLHEVGEAEFPPDIGQRIEDAVLDTQRWAARYGLPRLSTRFEQLAAVRLWQLGHTRFVLEHCPCDLYQRGSTLYCMGRFDELLADPDLAAGWSCFVLSDERRYGEIPSNVSEGLRKLLLWRHERDQDRAAFARSPTAAQPAWAAKELADERKDAQVWVDVPMTAFLPRPSRLLQLGRDQDLLSQYPNVPSLIEVLAMRMIEEGQRDAGEALFRRANQMLWDLEWQETDSERMCDAGFAHFISPLILDLDAGRPVDAAAVLGPQLPFLHDICQQQLWYMASYLCGRIDEQAFLSQPVRRLSEPHLALVEGMRAELNHQPAAALVFYRQLVEATKEPDFIDHFAAWRRHRLEGGN